MPLVQTYRLRQLGLIPQSDFLDCRPALPTKHHQRLEEEIVLMGSKSIRRRLQSECRRRRRRGVKCAISGFISSYLSGPSIRLSCHCYQLGHLAVAFCNRKCRYKYMQLMSHSLSLDTPINCMATGGAKRKWREKSLGMQAGAIGANSLPYSL